MQSVAASRFPFPSHPIGWFCAAFSSEIGVGEVKTFHYFDQDIVLYRTESGAVHAVDAHCPHLGAHLGVGGCVVGETIRCPFHSWRFDGEGRCVEVPYSDKIPPRGNTRGWPICEVNELIFIWHHPTGEPPSWEVPAVETEGWTEDRTVTWELKTHPQEVYENTADVAHLPPIHHVKQSAVVKKPRVEEHLMETDIQFLASGETVGAAGVEVLVHLNVTMRGLGHLISMTHVPEHDIRARQRLFPIPVTRDSIVLRCLVNTKVMPDAAFTAQIAEQMYQAFVFDFARDFPIWENKVYVDRPALAKGDGPIGAYRNWAKRFYLESGNGNGNGAHAVAASPVAPAAAAGPKRRGATSRTPCSTTGSRRAPRSWPSSRRMPNRRAPKRAPSSVPTACPRCAASPNTSTRCPGASCPRPPRGSTSSFSGS